MLRYWLDSINYSSGFQVRWTNAVIPTQFLSILSLQKVLHGLDYNCIFHRCFRRHKPGL
jgi:hypothetical protein